MDEDNRSPMTNLIKNNKFELVIKFLFYSQNFKNSKLLPRTSLLTAIQSEAHECREILEDFQENKLWNTQRHKYFPVKVYNFSIIFGKKFFFTEGHSTKNF